MKIRMMQKVIATLFFLTTAWGFQAGNLCRGQEVGNPFIKNLGPETYNAHSQNFTVAQDKRGVMYFGNFSGILEYDGDQWRLIPTENISRVSSLSIAANGIVYVGARGEMGYLSPDPSGNMAFVSLNDLIPSDYRNFLDVLGTYATSKGVYFVTEQFIFFYDFDFIQVTEVDGGVLSSQCIHDTLYCWVENKGLVKYGHGHPELLVDRHSGDGILEIRVLITVNDTTFLLGTAGQGLFWLRGRDVEGFRTNAGTDLTGIQFRCGVQLQDGTFAFGTERNGIIIVEPGGNIRQVINAKNGLRNDNVAFLYKGREGNLWAALNNGLALIAIPSPISYFVEQRGISGGVTDITRINSTLFVSTYQGLFHYDMPDHTFKSVSGITTGCWAILPDDDGLLAATSKGVYQVRGLRPVLITEGSSYALCRSAFNPSILYAGQTGSMLVMEKTTGQWKTRSTVTGINGEIMEIAEEKDGSVWMNTPLSGLYLYRPAASALIQRYDTTSGLPFMTGNHLSKLTSGIQLNTRQGLYRYNPESKAFEVFQLFPEDSINRNIWLKSTVEDHQGNLWTTNGDDKGITFYRRNQGILSEKVTTPYRPLNDLVVWNIYTEKNGIVWFGGPDGLFRYDPSVHTHHDVDFQTLIRQVTIKGDSTVFRGTFYDRDGITAGQPGEYPPMAIDYAHNSILFEYASVSMHVRGENEYQYILEGFDKGWSEWRNENTKEYTNLPKGDYVFRVRSKNAYDRISNDAVFSFRILTPWYRLWWAYLLYALILGGIVYLIVRLRSRKLLKEKQALEEVIQERTTEVVRQKEEIEHKSLELSEKNYELERINKTVKSINEEIHVARLTESVLEKMSAIPGVERALALVRDQSAQIFRYKAGFQWDTSELENIQYELEEAEERYLKNALEVHEDIFVKSDPVNLAEAPEFKQTGPPRSMIILVIKVEEKVEGMLLFMNMTRENAFDMRDLGFLKNSKEHIISAFIKSRILEDLQHTLENLKETQKQLIQSEKLASLGQLTAGIAHEIQNPLNFVNNFSSLSMDLTRELTEYIEKEKGNLSTETLGDIEEVITMLDSNVKKINEHGKRAERIVKGMLQHSRGKSGEFLSTDLNTLVEEYVNLSYHGIRAENKEFNATFVKDFDPGVGKVKIVPQDFSRVILNIMNNACYAVFEKSQKKKEGYTPTIGITTQRAEQQVIVRIKDNGTGIPQSILDKIFNPFFTTKPTGKGTGLGLSMSYDIVTNIHNGKLDVISVEGESTEFVVTIPDIK
ncbi:MAG TPA: ATP-binding protein [Bacteroidales bacterium]|nr:ATP-binding protein [Bacteroidales bacterium]